MSYHADRCRRCNGQDDADPHVPDADGNPIRVGQLVERIEPVDEGRGFLEPPPIRWVSEVDPGRGTIDAGEWYLQDSGLWRVVTDTFRPLEPDTRDVTLRVTLRDCDEQTASTAEADVMTAVSMHYRHGDVDQDLDGMKGIAVEVVDDGGHDDG